MAGNAALTRQRILDAAIAEFSAYGIAGARIDRVAEGSGSNKAMIYKYFGDKGRLFDAVFDAMVVQTVDAVPIDPDDLPEYVARLWDQHRAHPEPLRIGLWDELERSSAGMRVAAVQSATQAKVAAIAEAQRRGVISTALPARILLEVVLALSRTGLTSLSDEPLNDPDAARYRAALTIATRQFVDPT